LLDLLKALLPQTEPENPLKKPDNKNNTKEIYEHILEIASGKCEITEEKVQNEPNKDHQLILSSLLHLHQNFQNQVEKMSRNEELEKLNSQLKAKNREMEQFAYIASHDLQEPVRTISNFARLLQSNYSGKFDETADKSLEFMIGASERMSSLIKGLLDYSRIGREVRLATVNCNQLLVEIIQDLSAIIDETDTILDIDVLPEVIGNPTDLRLVFQNLINNAIKFRKNDTNPIVEIKAKNKKRSIEFSCKDNGIGIDKKHNKKIFQIFQRLHSRNEYAGTGIGLSHCRKVVELHGGKIWVKSKPNVGSTFYFTIPN
jgi:light-regulated signal transduction histidine kinase (bacteriophytochrome)